MPQGALVLFPNVRKMFDSNSYNLPGSLFYERNIFTYVLLTDSYSCLIKMKDKQNLMEKN